MLKAGNYKLSDFGGGRGPLAAEEGENCPEVEVDLSHLLRYAEHMFKHHSEDWPEVEVGFEPFVALCYIYIYMCIYTIICILHLSMYIYIYIHIHTYIYIYIHLYVC